MKNDKPITLVFVLTLICVIASLAVGLTYNYCSDKIFEQIKLAREKALYKAQPDGVKFELKQAENGFEYYEAFNADGEMIGYTFEGSASGYSSVIKVMVGVDLTADTIKGICVTSQKETPGLGANIQAVKTEGTLWSAIASIGKEKAKKEEPEPYFQKQFKDNSIDNLKVVKTAGTPYIEAITGATISSEAVTTAVKEAITNFKAAVIEPNETGGAQL
jgi:H+/Na+-translocating ferredoxin:NAD+ oxidoreductase subunit G